MAKLKQVFKFEFLNTVTKRSFILSVILVPLIPAILFFALNLLNQNDNSPSLTEVFTSEVANPLPVGVVDQSGLIKDYPDWLTQGNLLPIADEATARQQTADNLLEGFYIVSADYLESGKVTFIKPEINMITELVQQGALDNLINYNLMGSDQDLFLRYTNPLNYTFEYINEATADTRDQGAISTFFTPYVIIMFFYMLILISSSFMLSAVGKDKDNKTIEVLLTSAKPLDLFGGKLLAFAASSLLQLLAWGGGIAIIMNFGGNSLSFMQGMELPTRVFTLGTFYFLLGFFLYGSLMAGFGALAPNMREGNQASFIIMIPLIFSIMIMQQVIQNPNGGISLFLSLFPPTSSVIMMARLSINAVPFWQIALSLLLLIATVGFVIRAVTNMFSSQTLLSGEKFEVKKFFRMFLSRK